MRQYCVGELVYLTNEEIKQTGDMIARSGAKTIIAGFFFARATR